MMTPFNIKERKYTQNLRMQELIIYDNGANTNKVEIDYWILIMQNLKRETRIIEKIS